jgi:hypothetical protein
MTDRHASEYACAASDPHIASDDDVALVRGSLQIHTAEPQNPSERVRRNSVGPVVATRQNLYVVSN